MTKNVNTHGGGAFTNLNGLHFEQTTSLDTALKKLIINYHPMVS